MMFKGHSSLRFASLVLFAVLFASGSARTQAQPAQDASYRILMADRLTQPRAQEAKRILEGLKLPAPVRIDEVNGQYRVTYGEFPSKEAAEQARAALNQGEGVISLGVVTAGRPAPALPALTRGDESLAIFVRQFNDRSQAEELKRKLETEYGTVIIRQLGAFYEVLVGPYGTDEAATILGQLRKEGYQTAEARALPPAQQSAPQGIVTAPAMPDPKTDIDSPVLPITQTAAWKSLTEAEKAKVMENADLQATLRKGDPLAQQMIDISKRLEKLDTRLQGLVKTIDDERTVLEEKRKKVNVLLQDAENNIRSEKYKEAILLLNSALEMDKDNSLNLKQYIERRIDVANYLNKGEKYPGETEVNKKRAAALQQNISRLKISNDKQDLYQAINLLSQVKDLDPNMAKDADAQIASLNQRLGQINDDETKTANENRSKLMYALGGLAGAVGVLLVLVLFVIVRTKKRHNELMRKVQEITSIRPMRELEGGGPQMLGGSESDIFSPMNPAQEGVAGDPLGGVLTPPPAPDKKAKGKKGKAAPEPAPVAAAAGDMGLDDIFGGGDMPGAGGDMGLDDIFGSPAPTPAAAPAKAPAPAATAKPAAQPKAPEPAPTAAIDDIFGGLFTDESQAPASKPVAAEEADDNSPAHDTGPISFGDFMSGGQGTETQASPAESDLLTVFDEPANGNANGQEVDPLQDSPFGSMFSDEPTREAPASNTPQDDTEIPSIKLDMTGAEGDTQASPSFGGFELHDISNAGATQPGSESLDLPTFSFDDLVGATSVTSGNGPAGIALDFADAAAGQSPSGWEGQYPFARLTVEADTPPRGTQQYLCFEKQEGAGKAHYSCRFPEVDGLVGIEFDLRCNDKNKFLLGFYVEKDGDFQHSIHTKILRSEAQTSPTIHMQGQSAPYLLGSWAHIKYVVDLKEGKLNGYIDSTHVVRDLPLSPNPGSLNTLSIRDNINTTGVLLLANIKVYPM